MLEFSANLLLKSIYLPNVTRPKQDKKCTLSVTTTMTFDTDTDTCTFSMPFSTIYYYAHICRYLYCCPDIYLLHLLINKSRGHFVEKSVCVDKQAEKRKKNRKKNKWICNKSYDFRKSFQKLCSWIYTIQCVLLLYSCFFFHSVWLSILQTIAQEIVPKKKTTTTTQKESETPSRIGKRNKTAKEMEWKPADWITIFVK